MKHIIHMKIVIVLTIILVLTCALVFVGCDKVHNAVYDGSEVYEVEVTEEFDAIVYAPKGVAPTRGFLFYVGTAMTPKVYSNIVSKIASNGYYIALPKVPLNFTYMSYQTKEKVLDNVKNIKFAIGGHSQGGGAAARRLAEEQYSSQTIGGVFLSPLFYKLNDLREWDKSVLLIEAENDKVLTQKMKDDARDLMPKDTTSFMINGGNHMAYSSMSFPADGVLAITEEEQQELTSQYILNYLNKLSW